MNFRCFLVNFHLKKGKNLKKMCFKLLSYIFKLEFIPIGVRDRGWQFSADLKSDCYHNDQCCFLLWLFSKIMEIVGK